MNYFFFCETLAKFRNHVTFERGGAKYFEEALGSDVASINY